MNYYRKQSAGRSFVKIAIAEDIKELKELTAAREKELSND
jgi:hypothetical protein